MLKKKAKKSKLQKEWSREEKLLEESFVIMEKNKILFAPLFIGYVFTFMLILAYFMATGFLDRLLASSSVLFDIESLFFAFVGDSPLNFIILTIIYFSLELCLAAYFMTMDYGMIKDILRKGKTSFESGTKFAKKHFKDVIGIFLISAAIILVPLGILGVILFYFFTVLSVPGNIILPIFFTLAFLILIYISLRLLFVIPTMSLKDRGALSSVRDDFHYVKTHCSRVFVSWFFVLTVLLVYGLVRVPISILHPLTENVHLFIAILVFIVLLDTVVWVWEHILIFKVYMQKGHMKRK